MSHRDRSMEQITVATVTMNSGPDRARNIDRAVALTREAAAAGAQWILLPEVWPFIGPYRDLFDNAEETSGDLCRLLSDLARELRVTLFAGTVGERPGEDLGGQEPVGAKGDRRVYNTMYVFRSDGSLAAQYRKIHLFNIEVPGGASYRESDGYLAGDHAVTCDIDGWRVALAICYDLRFPALFEKLSSTEPADVFMVPAAFIKDTGMYHWETLLRARAIDQLAYVVASNQTGQHAPGKFSFGHSMIVDPWGHKVADTGDAEGFVLARIHKARVREVRGKLPALRNRRPECY